MLKLMPALCVLTNKKELQVSNGKMFLKASVAIEDIYYWVTFFGDSAVYIANDVIVGSHIFLENWYMKQNGSYYDFNISKFTAIKKHVTTIA